MAGRVIPGVLIVAALIAILLFSQQRHEPFHVSGFIEADEIRLGSRIGGRVRAVHVAEGSEVEPGQLLVELEPFDLLERQAEARARHAQQSAMLSRLQHGFLAEEIAQAQARRDQAQALLDKLNQGARKQEIDAAYARQKLAEAERDQAQQHHDRIQTLFEKNSSTREAMDDAITRLHVAESTLLVASDELALVREGPRKEDIRAAEAAVREAEQAQQLMLRGTREESLAEAEAAVNAAAASVAAIDQQVAELHITAPVRGTVDAIDLQPGDLISANAPAISLIDADHLWVRTYVPENRLSISAGQTVTITVDSLPEQRFQGTVSFVSRQAEFTPGNVQTPEDRSRQVFRIRVTLGPSEPTLRPGMSADVWFAAPDDAS